MGSGLHYNLRLPLLPLLDRNIMLLKTFTKDVVKRCEATKADLMSEMDWFTGGSKYQGYMGFKDNGSDILAVAHVDYVLYKKPRVIKNLVVCPMLDDRLGVAIILDLLPLINVNVDVLLTDDEEVGQSTASEFQPQKDYKWIVEFDRCGLQVVTYEYEDALFNSLIEASGFEVGVGSYSDICYLSDMEVKGLNVGVGYHDEHSKKCRANMKHTLSQVKKFWHFYKRFKDVKLAHEDTRWSRYSNIRRFTCEICDIYQDEISELNNKVCKTCAKWYYSTEVQQLEAEGKILPLLNQIANGAGTHSHNSYQNFYGDNEYVPRKRLMGY